MANSKSIKIAATLILLIASALAKADAAMARNVLITTTGKIPTEQEIDRVNSQLQRMERLCSETNHGAPMGDKVAYSHSRLKPSVSIYLMLEDMERVFASHCKRYDPAILMGLYVLEQNDGRSRENTVHALMKSPADLVTKWNKRSAK